MGNNKTSAIFYRRGVSNQQQNFGFAMQSNYTVIQPKSLYISSQIKPTQIRVLQNNNTPLTRPNVPDPPTNIIEPDLDNGGIGANIGFGIGL